MVEAIAGRFQASCPCPSAEERRRPIEAAQQQQTVTWASQPFRNLVMPEIMRIGAESAGLPAVAHHWIGLLGKPRLAALAQAKWRNKLSYALHTQ